MSKEGREREGRGVGIAPKETARGRRAPLMEGRRRHWRVGPRRQRHREDLFVRPAGSDSPVHSAGIPQRLASVPRFVRPVHSQTSRTVRTSQKTQTTRFSLVPLSGLSGPVIRSVRSSQPGILQNTFNSNSNIL